MAAASRVLLRNSSDHEMRIFRSHQDEVVACMLEVHRSGLQDTGLWHGEGRPPEARLWGADVIAQLDRVLGIRLYLADAEKTKDPWRRLDLLLRAFNQGQVSTAPAIIRILQERVQADPLGKRRDSRTEVRVTETIGALIRRDVRGVLPLLREVERAVGDDRRYLAVWVAQLERDVPALERYARQRDGTWSFAMDALTRLGARDVLERLAADPTVYGRSTARMRLDKGLPLPTPIDVNASAR